jgi:hypothetical protein
MTGSGTEPVTRAKIIGTVEINFLQAMSPEEFIGKEE